MAVNEVAEKSNEISTGSSLSEKIAGKPLQDSGTVKKGRPSNAEKAEKEILAEREKIIREMFSDEVLEDMITLYPDLRFAMTGNVSFLMEEKDKKILTRLAKPCTAFIDADPKWIALFMFSTVALKVYGGMEMSARSQAAELKELDKKEKK